MCVYFSLPYTLFYIVSCDMISGSIQPPLLEPTVLSVSIEANLTGELLTGLEEVILRELVKFEA